MDHIFLAIVCLHWIVVFLRKFICNVNYLKNYACSEWKRENSNNNTWYTAAAAAATTITTILVMLMLYIQIYVFRAQTLATNASFRISGHLFTRIQKCLETHSFGCCFDFSFSIPLTHVKWVSECVFALLASQIRTQLICVHDR